MNTYIIIYLLFIICDRFWEKVHYGEHNDFSV